MIIAIAVVIIAAVIASKTLLVLMSGPVWPLWERGPLERERPDYKHINELELELGLPLSNYTAQGVDGSAMLAQEAEQKFKEFEQDGEDIADQLEPERVIIGWTIVGPWIDEPYPVEIIQPSKLSRTQKVARLEDILAEHARLRVTYGSEPINP